MLRHTLLVLAMATLFAGCSDLATKDAPIEDRSAAAGVASQGGQSGAQSGQSGQSGALAAGATTGTAAPGAGAQGVEVKPLPGAGEGPGGAGVSGSAMTTGPAQFAHLRTPPKDVAGPLGKRVIYFDYDSVVIKDEYREVIQAHAEFLKASKDAKSILQGHTDERGSRDYNLALGQRRAESVQEALALLGVDAGKLEAVSLGEEKPAQDGHDESAWSMNRRVEIYYQGE